MFINCYSVNLATGVMNAFTAAKLVAIMIIIAGGAYKLLEGEIPNPYTLPNCNLCNGFVLEDKPVQLWLT